MAPSPPWRTTLPPPLLLLLLALLLVSATHAGRAARDQVSAAAVATSRGHVKLRGQHREVDSKEEETMGFKTAADDNPCAAGEEGIAGDEDEECLMRRTLEVHTDYIYTQNGGHS